MIEAGKGSENLHTLNKLYDYEEIFPHRMVYESAHVVIGDFCEKKNKKIGHFAQLLDLSPSALYKKLDPTQTNRPFSIDLAIDITRITGDGRILNTMSVAALVNECESGSTDICMVHRIAAKMAEVTGFLGKTILEATEDKKIDDDEKKRIREDLQAIIREANESLKIVS